MDRKVIQIAISEAGGGGYSCTMMALCDDGTMWRRGATHDWDEEREPNPWRQVPAIPPAPDAF